MRLAGIFVALLPSIVHPAPFFPQTVRPTWLDRVGSAHGLDFIGFALTMAAGSNLGSTSCRHLPEHKEWHAARFARIELKLSWTLAD